jgi:hypothetical protein
VRVILGDSVKVILNKERKFLTIGRLEIYIGSEFSFGRIDMGCDCSYLNLGWIGFAILRGEHIP